MSADEPYFILDDSTCDPYTDEIAKFFVKFCPKCKSSFSPRENYGDRCKKCGAKLEWKEKALKEGKEIEIEPEGGVVY